MLDFDVDAVLFDLDGTLVDSSASVLRAWESVAAELGIAVSEFEPYVHGIPATRVFADVVPALSADEAQALSRRMNAAQADDTGGVTALPGALDALNALPGERWAIVTSGDRRLATARIGAAGMPMPGVLITSDDVRAGKPDPQCYLAAAGRLGFGASRCLVVEDAPAGVSAGLAAGMAVLGVLTTYPHLDATATVANLSTVDFTVDFIVDGAGVRVSATPRGALARRVRRPRERSELACGSTTGPSGSEWP